MPLKIVHAVIVGMAAWMIFSLISYVKEHLRLLKGEDTFS